MKAKPVLGILLGDSAGIGPEIVAKTIASGFLSERCRPLVIGDFRVLDHAFHMLGEKNTGYAIHDIADASWENGIPVLDQKDQDPSKIKIGQISAGCGQACVNMLKLASQLCLLGKIEGFVFAPLNKSAMMEGGSPYASEHHLLADAFKVTGFSGEINLLGDLMTTRVTSHIPISEVSQNLTSEKIMDAIELADRTVKSYGIAQPRIAVSALNPHCGENGRCGREEIDVIAPAVQAARGKGIDAQGPFPPDNLFVKAFQGKFDGVVTMYHDQGQIALKLKDFGQGITVVGGMPYPVATCAHGTAYDIAGTGIAATASFENAVAAVARMAEAK